MIWYKGTNGVFSPSKNDFQKWSPDHTSRLWCRSFLHSVNIMQSFNPPLSHSRGAAYGIKFLSIWSAQRKSNFLDPPPVLIEYMNIHWQASNALDDNWTTKEMSQICRIYPRQNWQPGEKSLWESKRQKTTFFWKFLHFFVFVKWRPFLCRFCSV